MRKRCEKWTKAFVFFFTSTVSRSIAEDKAREKELKRKKSYHTSYRRIDVVRARKSRSPNGQKDGGDKNRKKGKGGKASRSEVRKLTRTGLEVRKRDSATAVS
ncbi:hypothetical protein BDV06DRAFT_162192 [Aspergillus oleicola]